MRYALVLTEDWIEVHKDGACIMCADRQDTAIAFLEAAVNALNKAEQVSA